jgi:hypothetical protein
MKKIKKQNPQSNIENSLLQQMEDQRQRYYAILNYIINKNSHPMPRGVDYERLFDDIQDFEQYLLTN